MDKKHCLFSCVTQLVVQNGQDSAILPSPVAMQSQCRIWFILSVHVASHMIKIVCTL